MGSEMDRIHSLGGSLPVQNVQALAFKNLKDVPSRYVRPENEFDEVSVDESNKVPMIDMSKLVGGHEDELTKLHFACRDWGFFQLINHGVPEEVIEEIKVDLQEFFKLPLEEKMVCAQQENSVEGYGQAFVISEEQKLDWGDMLFLISQPVRATLERYSCELKRTSQSLLRLMARNLGLDLEELVSKFYEGRQGIRMNYYPPCLQANKVIGLKPHSDATGLTLLLQVNDVPGLQIKKNCKWVPIKPIPGAFIVNIGDILEIMSNGEYKSIEHRAVVNPEKERMSIAAFHGPDMKAIVGPLPDIVKESKANYKSISYEEFVRILYTSNLGGKRLLDRMKSEP